MRAILLVAVLLLAGCSAPAAPAPAISQEEVPEVPVSVPVSFQVESAGGCLSSLCLGSNVDLQEAQLSGAVLFAFDLEIRPADDPVSQRAGDLLAVRFVATCRGEHARCPDGELADAMGAFPLRLKADGFRIEDVDQLNVAVQYVGPDPWPFAGNTATYLVEGTVTAIGEPVLV